MCDTSQCMNAGGNVCDTLGPVINSVGGRHVGQQRLCGTNVGCSLVTTNMLLTCLHSHAQAWFARGIYCHPNNAAWHFARVFIGGTEEACVWSPKSHGHTKSLCRPNGNICAPRGRGCQLGQGHEIGRGDDHCTSVVHSPCKVGVGFPARFDGAIRVGVLDNRPTIVTRRKVSLAVITYHDLDSNGFGSCFDESNGLGVDILTHKEMIFLSLFTLEGKRHLHRFGSR
mmetsp:Transcript_14398/g.40002  ORF Transcript_14398/g.40002 Transcript_14398/m.40002 type:complete len:227 (-) Transcript_14398:600-1280(-)